MSVDTVAGTTVWRMRVATVWMVIASIMCYCSNIDSGYFRFMPVDTVAGTTEWRLRVSNIWVVTASGMCYCSNIRTVATLGLCPLTQLLAQQCGV